MEKLLIYNIGLLATPIGSSAQKGREQGKILQRKNAWILAEKGIITSIGYGESWKAIPQDQLETLNANGCLVTPGLVDAHTHLIFGGWRQNELGLRLHGKSYLDILSSGGGILSTVRSTRSASQEDLYQKAWDFLNQELALGVTSIEIKSGYGLDRESELKQLHVANKLKENHVMDIRSTYLGAHALPLEYNNRKADYVSFICKEMIPEVAAEKLADFCDVFCEKGAFTAKESRKILETGIAYGLPAKIHADEIEAIGGSELCAEMKMISAEHLIVCQPAGINALAKGCTIACLLPATSFYSGFPYAPARDMLDAGVPIAIATDFNPGSCPSLNIQLVMNLACLKYKLTPEEMLTAVTLNGAAAIGLSNQCGSIEPGKQADLVIWNALDLNYLAYRMGSNLVKTVIKKGQIVHSV